MLYLLFVLICAVSAQFQFLDKITAADAEAGARFGDAVAMDGDRVVVGAPRRLSGGSFRRGSAYIFNKNYGGADNWGQVALIGAPDMTDGDEYGSGVAVSGTTVAVGSPLDDDGGSMAGSAYVYYETGSPTSWTFIKKVVAPDPAALDAFGRAISVSGDTLIVGAAGKDDVGSSSGVAYVYSRNRGGTNNWGLAVRLTASDIKDGARFGNAVAISGSLAIVGAENDDSVTGAAYIFAQNLGGTDNWGQVRKIRGTDTVTGDRFGRAVAISGTRAIVGADRENQEGTDAGAAYIFYQNLGGVNNWGQARKLRSFDHAPSDFFGSKVSISGDYAVVGVQNNDDAGAESGSTYVFQKDETGPDFWGQVAKLTASDAAAGDRFGCSVAISGSYLVSGAYGDSNAGAESGSAYIFKDIPTPPVSTTSMSGFASSSSTTGDNSGGDNGSPSASTSSAASINGIFI